MELTAARRRALGVLCAFDGRARESNTTDTDRGYIYWQSLNWLLEQGLAEEATKSPPPTYRLTAAGRQLIQGGDL